MGLPVPSIKKLERRTGPIGATSRSPLFYEYCVHLCHKIHTLVVLIMKQSINMYLSDLWLDFSGMILVG
jgi:hypothetical protein